MKQNDLISIRTLNKTYRLRCTPTDKPSCAGCWFNDKRYIVCSNYVDCGFYENAFCKIDQQYVIFKLETIL
ncbi:MAG: hypothetical protein PHR53_02510 [Bacteroidales bacterium]|nr:hypothetical protein [Bacteroidales bacterium]